MKTLYNMYISSMETVMIDPRKTYTKTEYSKAYNVSRPTIDKKINSKEINSVKIKGATLIIAS